MREIIARIDALLANTPPAEIEEFEVTRCLRDCRDEIIAARACAEMMLQGTGQRLAESMAERVINGQQPWIPVSERLPPDRTVVLAWQGKRVVFGYARDGEWIDTLYGWMIPNGPSHWMPLPEPPEVT